MFKKDQGDVKQSPQCHKSNQSSPIPDVFSRVAEQVACIYCYSSRCVNSHRPLTLAQCPASIAHCLYVLTDDNYPAIDAMRSNSAYVTCLLEVVRQEQVFQNGQPKEPSDEREIAFRVLASGPFLISCALVTLLLKSINT